MGENETNTESRSAPRSHQPHSVGAQVLQCVHSTETNHTSKPGRRLFGASSESVGLCGTMEGKCGCSQAQQELLPEERALS